MGPETERAPYLDRLFENNDKKTPLVKGQPVDLFRLYGAVQERGGMEECQGMPETLEKYKEDLEERLHHMRRRCEEHEKTINHGEAELLYEMGQEPEWVLFLDRIFQNQEKKTPRVKGQPLDLFRLYGAVQERGGMEETEERKLLKAKRDRLNISLQGVQQQKVVASADKVVENVRFCK
ncbi:uncharacterized protein LOC123564426 [Mercenaria mercenaria]|uniref:uncharacterized protein LOC123564426 n=1 Tax=Mercenaria mercenaria TaxID=6596 RepID=UPI00234F9FF8|nr:uncharacterized protein LOC123564426 [Mercenaria mercenaria]